MEYTHKGLRPDRQRSRRLSIMDKVCTLMATCLETCILWPYGDLRFFRRPVREILRDPPAEGVRRFFLDDDHDPWESR